MRLEIKVLPGAGKDEVSEDGGAITVRVKAQAKDNKANVAVLKVLRKHFGKEVRFVSGLKSRKKTVEIS